MDAVKGTKDLNGDWAGTDEEGAEGVGGWEDYALCVGAEMMANIRRAVHQRLGYTCSAGVGHNKTLSKVGCYGCDWRPAADLAVAHSALFWLEKARQSGRPWLSESRSY